MRNFCTFFNKNYLLQGLSLYKSLAQHCEDFFFYIIALDEVVPEVVKKLKYPNITVIPLAELETEELLAGKERASKWQYVGVIQPFVCEYCLKVFKLDAVTYVDADIMFFSSPEPIFAELGGDLISIVPHRYSPEHNREETSGIYCVQFNTFYNDERSKKALAYWEKDCFKYTKDRPEYFPGQLSLDNWEKDLAGIKSIQNIGAGAAPWNIENYTVQKVDDEIMLNDEKLIFYHFHQFGWNPKGEYHYCSYALPDVVIELIYQEYTKIIEKVEADIRQIAPDVECRKIVQEMPLIKKLIIKLLPNRIFKTLLKIKHKLGVFV